MPQADLLRARSFFDDLLRWEVRGPGDTNEAMKRISRRETIPFGKLWALRYRPPKEIASHILARIEAAHAAERERQLKRLAHDAAITAVLAGPDHPSVVAAEAVLRAAGQPPARCPRRSPAPALVRALPAPGVPSADAADLTDLPLWRVSNGEE